jgi:hypothetical protein
MLRNISSLQNSHIGLCNLQMQIAQGNADLELGNKYDELQIHQFNFRPVAEKM